MSQLRDQASPTRRPDVLGIHSLDHFQLTVNNLAEAKQFYSAFGLVVREERGTMQLYTDSNDHRWATVGEGPRKSLQHLSFGAFADDIERFRQHLDKLHIERMDPPKDVESNGLWFRDCDGTPIEIKAAEKTSPNAQPSFELGSAASEDRASPLRSTVGRVHPRRLSHVLIFVRDVDRSIGFYRDALGLRLSDVVPGFVAFMYGVHGSDHHLIAFAKSDAPGLHHCSWAVDSIHDIGQGAEYMAGNGFIEGWGLGRHALGSNYFHYVRDPWGSYAEYSGGFDYIGADQAWEGAIQTPENGFYLWGPAPPEDFAFNYEAAPDAWRAKKRK